MINKDKLENLYQTISKDLKIDNFGNEPDIEFYKRVVYSAIGKWVMQLFADRDFEEEGEDQVSKSHVTIAALEVLASYKKIDSSLDSYFCDDKKFIKDIENIYVTLGYINSGNYSFKYPQFFNRVSFQKKTLIINLDTTVKRMRGLGIWGKNDESVDMPLEEFLMVNNDANTIFKNILSKLNFEDFNSKLGKIEVYNIKKNKWEYFSEKETLEYEYYILKVDDGLDYQILRNIGDLYYAASLPSLYTKTSTDSTFFREIWRIILGLCCYNEYPATCYLSKYYNEGIKLSFWGYILPYFEYSLLKCLAWPLGDSNGINEFVTDISMKESVIKLLEKLSINVINKGDF